MKFLAFIFGEICLFEVFNTQQWNMIETIYKNWHGQENQTLNVKYTNYTCLSNPSSIWSIDKSSIMVLVIWQWNISIDNMWQNWKVSFILTRWLAPILQSFTPSSLLYMIISLPSIVKLSISESKQSFYNYVNKVLDI